MSGNPTGISCGAVLLYRYAISKLMMDCKAKAETASWDRRRPSLGCASTAYFMHFRTPAVSPSGPLHSECGPRCMQAQWSVV